jgi:hypothetical protein
VTTDPPRYVPHLEWTLAFTVAAEQPLRLAVMLEAPSEVAWGLVAHTPSTSPKVEAKFFPYDWSKSDDVQVNFEWQRLRVSDPELKDDPRRVVTAIAPTEAETGSRIPVATLPAHDLTLALIALADRDTERRREGRWRLRPALADALEPLGSLLASGHQNGTVRP